MVGLYSACGAVVTHKVHSSQLVTRSIYVSLSFRRFDGPCWAAGWPHVEHPAVHYIKGGLCDGASHAPRAYHLELNHMLGGEVKPTRFRAMKFTFSGTTLKNPELHVAG